MSIQECHILSPLLVQLGRIREAFAEAEKYKDFRLIVELTMKAHSGDELTARLVRYMSSFGYPFCEVLFTWYLDQGTIWTRFVTSSFSDQNLGQLYQLMNINEEFRTHLSRYFESHEHSKIAWINDICVENYGTAQSRLLEGGYNIEDLGKKNVSSCICRVYMLNTPF
jgi:hypothetical protein